MADTWVWVLFVVLFVLLAPLWVSDMSFGAYIITIGLATFQNYRDYVDMPASVFWILFVLLLPTVLIPGSFGSAALYALVIAHVNLTNPDVPKTWLLADIFWLVFVMMWPLSAIFTKNLSPPSFVIWMTATIYMRDKIHFLMNIGYWLAWPSLYSFLLTALPVEMPISWHAMSLSIITGSALLIHPELSLGRLWGWIVAIFFIYPALRPFYVFFFYYPETYLFPFNLVARRWKVSSPRWTHISERADSTSPLCDRCIRFTSESELIMGSDGPLVRLVEWHTPWNSPDELRRSARMEGQHACPVCHLLWYSVSEKRRAELCVGSNLNLIVKIWEERPLSRYTFAQLYQGANPVGLRLLIHRGDLYQKSSLTCQLQSTESDRHIAQAYTWINECKKHHRLCNGVGVRPRTLPTRLVYIQSSGTTGIREAPQVKLVVTEPGNKIEYLAFSHCWGNGPQFKSLKSNYNASLENIVFSDMTKNMRDAVQITVSLGFSYLWIDSLCIIQDSKEDWEAEAKTMGDVYAGAACTIASTGSPSSDGGCFHERSALGLQPCVIGASSRNHLIPEWIYIRRDDLSEFRRGVDHAVLNSRGWVLQERLLSRRILHFGAEMMYWECCQRAASELNPTGYIYKLYPQEYYGNYVPVQTDTDPRERERVEGWSRTALIRRRTPAPDFDPDHIFAGRTIWQGPRGFWKEARRWSAADWRYDDSHKRFRTALDKLQNDEFWSDVAGMGSFSTCWYEIVELYTRTRLTYSSDKLVAIWGIVQQIEKQTKQQCVAGLWSGYLLPDLLWFTAEGPGRRLLEDPPKVLLTANPGSIPAESAHDELAGESQSNDTEADQHATLPTIERVAMAPTWSWASLEAIITNDLLPENAGRKVYLESLAQDVKASVRAVRPEQEGELRAALAGILEMRAPISRISKLKQQGEAWIIGLERNAYPTARLFPDIEISEESAVQDDLFCVACVVLKREAEEGVLNRKIEEVQGIVVRKTERRVDKPDLFQRVGFFTTNRMEKPSSHRKQLKNGRMDLIYIE